MNGWALFFLLLLLLVILPTIAWLVYTRWNAHRHGLPPPPLSAYNPFKKSQRSNTTSSHAPRGRALSWIQDKWVGLTKPTGQPSSGRGRHAPLDPDGAWDDRVGAEADAYGPVGDYEEQELGLQPSRGSRHESERTALPLYGQGAERGRSRTRFDEEDTAYAGGQQGGLDQRYDEEMDGGRRASNPFADEHEAGASLRGVSPRPVEREASRDARRSHFTEGI